MSAARPTRTATTALVALLLSFPATAPAAPPENRLRNGSFEGSLLYWHVEPRNHTALAGLQQCGVDDDRGAGDSGARLNRQDAKVAKTAPRIIRMLISGVDKTCRHCAPSTGS